MSYHPFNPKTPALLPCECPIPEQKKHTTFENCRFGQKKVNFAPSTTTSTLNTTTFCYKQSRTKEQLIPKGYSIIPQRPNAPQARSPQRKRTRYPAPAIRSFR